MTNSQVFAKLHRGLRCLRYQNCWHRIPRQGQHMTQVNFEHQNFRFYDHFTKTQLSFCMMGFSLLKSILCIRLEAVFYLTLQIMKSLGSEKCSLPATTPFCNLHWPEMSLFSSQLSQLFPYLSFLSWSKKHFAWFFPDLKLS